MQRSILVIDDQREIRENLTEILTSEGFDAACATDGEDALQYLRHHVPDLILCDLMMPRMDGFEFVSRVRSDRRTAAIPFVFLTGRADKSDFRRGMDLGADDYVSKPWTVDGLLTAIRMRLQRRDDLEHEHEAQMKRISDEVRHSIAREMLDPLRGIIGFSEVLASHCGSLGRDYVAEISNDIRKSSHDLLRVIENFAFLLDTATGSGGAGAPAKTEPAGTLVREAALAVAREKGREADLTVVTDPVAATQPVEGSLVRKLLVELVDNAFGFSEAGTPVEVALRNAGNGEAELEIADRGCGIPSALVREMLPVGRTGDTYPRNRAGGTGLIVCREIVRRLNGKWMIESRTGGGTVVKIAFSTARQHETEQHV